MDNIRFCPNCYSSETTEGICPVCGFDPNAIPVITHTLPVGTKLQDRYLVGKVLGEGGFGITYVGFDTRLDMKVAIKEYYPVGYSNREHADNTHSVYSFVGEKGDFFKRGLDRFINEAKRLSKFAGEPGIVTVRDFFNENDTAYIVMEFVEGDSLKTVLEKHGKISEKSALELIYPIIKTLAKMHKTGIIHRDIAPDNIMLEPDGKAILIDFGSAMEATSDGRSTVAMIKFGFAPEEQHDRNHNRQGSWTDVYSICATLYNIIENEIPADAFDRLRGEPLKDFTANISENTKKAILKGLEISPKDRTQTMDELLDHLEGKKTPPNLVSVVSAPPDLPAATESSVTPTPKPINIKLMSAIAAVIMLCIAIPIIISISDDEPAIDVLDKDVTTSESSTTIADTTTLPETTTTTASETTTVPPPTTTPPTTTTTPPPTTPPPTTTTPPPTTTTPPTTTPPPTTTTPPPTTTTPRPTTTTPVTTTAPAIKYPALKTLNYYEPNYSKMTLAEEVLDIDGSILGYSHKTGDNFGGFVFALSDDYVEVYTTNGDVMTSKGTCIQISLKSQSVTIDGYSENKKAGYTYIGDVSNATWNGNGYYYYDYNSPECMWFDVKDGASQGAGYYFNGSDFYLRDHYYLDIKSETRLSAIDFGDGDGKYWYLDSAKTTIYADYSEYTGFSKISNNSMVLNSYGLRRYQNGDLYRGQFVNDKAQGMGIKVETEGVVYIGQFKNNAANGYGLLIDTDKKVRFVKMDNNTWTTIKELKDAKIDTSIFF